MSNNIENLREANLHDESRSRKKLKRKKRRRIFLIIFLLILAVAGFFIWDIYQRASSALKEMNLPINAPNLREEEGSEPLVLGDDPFSILILGIDAEDGGRGRSDAIMVATVNPNLDTTYLLSIARDTLVSIPGFHSTRINHAFAYGGLDLAVETIQNFLNIPIDYHVTLEMDNFYRLVDAFGGVTVYNNLHFWKGGYEFPLGELHLTGDMAYFYARMRFDDPRGDHGRAERQRDILSAMVDELAGVTVITRYQQILDSVGDAMMTNVTLNEMVTMSIGYNRALRNITNLSLAAPGRIMPEFGGMYLIPVPESQRLEMEELLRSHLELD